jgi:Domain of unknown function (DUF4214)
LLDHTCPPVVREVYITLLDVASEKTQFGGLELKKKVARWAEEFDRLRSPLLLVDSLLAKKVIAEKAAAEREGLFANVSDLHRALEQRALEIVGLNQVVTDRDTQIVSQTQMICERDSQAASLHQQISELESRIAALSQDVSKRDHQVIELNEIVSLREIQVTSLTQQSTDLSVQIASLNKVIAEREESLAKLVFQLESQLETSRQSEQESARREEALSKVVSKAQKEHERLIEEHSQLKLEAAREVTDLKQRAEQHGTLRARDQQESEKVSRLYHEAQRSFMLHLGAESKHRRTLQQELIQRESALQEEIIALRIEIEAQRHNNQIVEKQYSYEIDALRVEIALALKTTHALEGKLFAEQQENAQLMQELNELHHSVVRFEQSFTWRALTPLRKIGLLGTLLIDDHNKNLMITRDVFRLRRGSSTFGADFSQRPYETVSSAQLSAVSRSELQYANAKDAAAIATNIDSFTDAPKVVSNFEELMRYGGQQFVEVAYMTLLKRAPDVDGLHFYCGRLGNGADKMQIVHEIFFSEECRSSGIELSGLREAFLKSGLS